MTGEAEIEMEELQETDYATAAADKDGENRQKVGKSKSLTDCFNLLRPMNIAPAIKIQEIFMD